MYISLEAHDSIESCDAAGPGTGDAQAASVRTDHCVPRAVTEYNFQIKVGLFHAAVNAPKM